GLILAAETESELAAVLAHEIAHVTQRHITRSYAAMDRLAIPSIAAMAAAILIGTQNGEAGMAALAATQAGAAQYQVDMIRSNEKEADRVGIQTLAKAGLDPRSMPVFFERLQTAARYYGKPPEFLSTHPVTVSRIADSRNRAEQFPYRQYADSKSFYLVRAKLQVLEESNKEKLVLRFRKALDTGQYRSKLAARYGYALALKQAKKLKEARDVLRRLSKEEPDRISFLHELADIELAMGNATTAMSILEKGLALYPNSKMLVQGYARALLRVGQPNRALRLLTDYTHTQPPDPAIYWMLARCEEQAGNPIAAHISLGEYYFLMGDIAAAIDQLKRAKKQEPDDYYQASRIEARLKQLKTEAALRKKDK
ncbi:MAG: M48 family metallopeptidase, partial [Gammaproteobacteria bacterium]|nr:M48 family metallopeptidase [Gammaproteobacteria bacterium]